jgi:hypothetical protein
VLDPELDPELVLDPELEPEPELVLDPELVLAPLLLPDEDPELLPELPEDEPVPAVLLLHPANPPNARVARNVAETRAMGRRGLMGTDPSNGCARPDVTRERHRPCHPCFTYCLHETSWIGPGPRAGWKGSRARGEAVVARTMQSGGA